MISVLYVDDEPDLLEIGRIFLEQSGEFSVGTSTSAQEALSSLSILSYDAIISDYQMPGMDGIAFLKAVRERYGDIPFILFTGRGREEVVIDAINNGADFYVQKGGDPQAQFADLAHMIRQAVKMQRVKMSLAEQEQRLHDLQNSNDMIQSVAPDGHFLFVNKKWQDTLGYDEHELKNLTIFDIIHEESQEHCKEVFPKVIAGENVGIIDVIFKTRNGKKVFAEGIANCKITDGQPLYTRGIFKDVTDRKNAENALRESEEKFRTLVEYTLDGILILDPMGKILFANQAAGRLIGAENYREMIGIKNVLEFIAPESQGDAVRDFSQVAQGIDGYLSRYKVITTTDHERWVESIGKSIRFGDAPAILVSLRDITDRQTAEDELIKKNEDLHAAYEELNATEEELRQNYDELSSHERALRASEEKFRALVEHSLDGILITDFTGKILFANRSAGLVVDIEDYLAVIGKRNVMEFVAPESQAEVLRDFSKVAQGIDAYLVHYKLITETKREIWVECIGKKIEFGNSTAMLVSLRDVTERKRAEYALRLANRQLNLLTGITRHDILNKISVILGFIKIAETKSNDPVSVEYLRRIKSATTAIRSQIEFTRVYQDLGTNQPQWIGLDTIMPRSHIPATITLNADVQGIEVFADPMLEKVFFNLFDNSIRHGERVTEIRVASHHLGEDLVIVWEDNGTGIAADEKERIFERGFGKNTGFGLFIVREILSLTGITITETGEPGTGARFEIWVPEGVYRITGK
ncbi:MAG: PAS domain S-box protein [Methanoregula sp.]|jgi:PAS domain S-box-containing protein|uniref:PAS domain S-box protein n=1 Tax=Methanoregula sp. TaxID=2052170 RepID=UPI003C191BEC